MEFTPDLEEFYPVSCVLCPLNDRFASNIPMLTVSRVSVIFSNVSEYDPLEPNRRAIKARLGNLCDPCIRVLAKRDEEKKLLAGEGKS